MNNKRVGKEGYMDLKLDITQAFDRLEWLYFENLMTHMGFYSKWVGWIMGCILTLSYSVKINGEQHGFIKPTRGLRQGDPLSPYLFLICAKGLSSLLLQKENQEQLHGQNLSQQTTDFSSFVCKRVLYILPS